MISDLSFETLIEAKKAENRWYPTAIETFRCSIKIDMNIENARALLNNIAYNLQYIEFLEKEFAELKVSEVIDNMLVKSYVITGMSILEGVFSNLLKSNGWWKTTDLESLGTTQSNETNFSGENYVIKTEILKRVPPYMVQMNLDDMIRILSRHHPVLKVDHLVYPALRRLKEFRNRVHLQKAENNYDHDYNAFNINVKKEMGSILYDVMTSNTITSNPHVFDFLKHNKT